MRKTIQLPGSKGELTYYEIGEGSPLLFISGLADVPLESVFLRELGKRHKVFLPLYLRAQTNSSVSSMESVLDWALFFNDFLDALSISTVGVIGHSLGGMLAAELAAITPERISKLVLVNSLGLWRDEHPVLDFFTIPPHRMEEFLWHALEGDGHKAYRSLMGKEEGDLSLRRRESFAYAEKILWPIPDRGLWRRLYRIKSPVKIIWGREDRIVPFSYAADFLEKISGAKLGVIEDCGHLPMFEKPQDFISEIEEFI